VTLAREHLICIPLQSNKQTFAVFILSRHADPPFTMEEYELVQLFISYVSLALANAQLFEQTKFAEERQRLLLEQLPAILWTTDREPRFTSALGAGLDTLGLHASREVGTALTDLFQTADPAFLPIAAHRQALAGESVSYETTWRDHAFQAYVEPFRDTHGQIIGSIGLALDVTEQKQAAAALRASEARFAKMFAASPVSITLTRVSDGCFQDVNTAFLDLMGYQREEVIGRTARELGVWAQPEQRAQVVQALSERESVRSMELAFRTKSGAVLETLASMELIEVAGEHCILTITQDITELKRIEAARREAESRFRTLVEQLPAITYLATLDEASSTLYTSPQIESILGFPQAEWMADPDRWLTQVHPDDRARVLDDLARTRLNCGPAVSEYRMLTRDGRVVWFYDRATVVYDDAGQGRYVQGVMFEITERKQAEVERERLIGELREALANIKTLRGLVPICASCKKIRDDQGYWNLLETYISAHSEAEFSHGMCPECVGKLYPDLYLLGEYNSSGSEKEGH
jgi:PAS domain S-box-containing protein